MRKTTCLALLMVIATSVFSQQTPSVQTDYLQKSKNQKTAAWVLLGGGTVLIGTGFLIGDRKESSFDEAGTGVIIGGIGFLGTLGSIPLFLASAKNKRKANATTFLKWRPIPFVQRQSFVQHSFAAVSVRISL
jgi:hypothetical protein